MVDKNKYHSGTPYKGKNSKKLTDSKSYKRKKKKRENQVHFQIEKAKNGDVGAEKKKKGAREVDIFFLKGWAARKQSQVQVSFISAFI